MIVDCHTQIWNSQAQLGRATPVVQTIQADETHHLAASDPVDKAIVLAFKSAYLQAEIPNRFVAEYVRRNPAKMIGFAGIDPTDRDWLEELRVAQDDLRLKGVIISPEMQNYHPADTRAMRLYGECARRSMPVLFEQNHRHSASKMEFSQPMLLDEVAQEYPELPIVIARLGHPWVEQTVVLLGKHPNVYANVAGLLPQPWLSYSALVAAHEYGVMDKLLFGSDFPYRSPAVCIEALYSINQFSHGSNLPPIPREQLRGIVERDALELLGIAGPAQPNSTPASPIFVEDD
ncbi:MAG: amidohydrolase family protein [Phycisphaerae bacterium]|nr:amidohydrolase family protein [Phycisphaerae bacterium]